MRTWARRCWSLLADLVWRICDSVGSSVFLQIIAGAVLGLLGAALLCILTGYLFPEDPIEAGEGTNVIGVLIAIASVFLGCVGGAVGLPILIFVWRISGDHRDKAWIYLRNLIGR